MKSEVAAAAGHSVSRVKHGPGPALPGAGSRMDLPALKHGMKAEGDLLLCLTEQRFLPVTSTEGITVKTLN